MPKVQLPSGIWSKFDPKENGWADNVNENFCRIDAYTGQCILDQVTTLPGTANPGDKYVKTDTFEIAVWYDGQFNLFPMPCGWSFYDQSNSTKFVFDGSSITIDSGAPGISTTTGSTVSSNPSDDAGKFLLTNIDGYIDGNFTPNIPVFADSATFEFFYDRPGQAGDRFFDSTQGKLAVHDGTSWGTLNNFDTITVTGDSNLNGNIFAGGQFNQTNAAETSSFAGGLNVSGSQLNTGSVTMTDDVNITASGTHSVSAGFANESFRSVTRATSSVTASLGNVLREGENGNEFITSTSFVTLNNQNGNLVCSGNRPVMMCFLPANQGGLLSQLHFFGASGDDGSIAFFRNGTQVSGEFVFGTNDNLCPSLITSENPPAGTHNYTVRAKMESGATGFQILNYFMFIYEI